MHYSSHVVDLQFILIMLIICETVSLKALTEAINIDIRSNIRTFCQSQENDFPTRHDDVDCQSLEWFNQQLTCHEAQHSVMVAQSFV